MKISVIIPCHNGQPYLSQAIRSVLDQKRAPDEVILIDDSSTDDSAAIADSFGAPVRVESMRFGNAARTRNYGASLAGGDALMFMDADDVLAPDALDALGSEVERHPNSIATCPWFRLELKGGRWLRQPPSCEARLPGQDALDAWLRGWYQPPCSILWSRSAYERVGPWDPQAGPNDDGDLMMRALVLGVPLRMVSRGSAFYRRMPEGTESLSGTRLGEEGLLARIHVVVKIAQLLSHRMQLDRYRPAVGHALSRIMWDASNDYPEIAAMCRSYRRTYGEPAWRRVARNLLQNLRNRRTRAAPDVRGPQLPAPGEIDQDDEVRFGLESSQ